MSRYCSNCRYNKYEKSATPFRYQNLLRTGGKNGRFICNNEDSDAYTCETQYDDSCELWEDKRNDT